MLIPRDRIFSNANEFFLRDGSGAMRLTPDAARRVCLSAAENGFLVGKIEGGIWYSPGFGSRLDCIWDSKVCPPVDRERTRTSNAMAAQFVDEESGLHDVFIVTTLPL